MSAKKEVTIHMVHTTNLNWSNEMNLMYENLARDRMQTRLNEAQEWRRANQLQRAKRLARRAERVSAQARLLLARSV